MLARTLTLALAALLFAACQGDAAPPPSAPGPSTRLKLMSFNIRYPAPQDGDNLWPQRQDAVGRFLLAIAPDVLGVQEATPGQVADLDRHLGAWARVGEGRDGRGHGEACILYYRKDRFDLLGSETFWLSPTPASPSVGWDAVLRRVATWARLRDRVTGEVWVVMNTHLDHKGEQARLESARLILRRLDELAGDGPLILMGDFNATDADPPFAVLTSGEGSAHGPLRDSRSAATLGRFGPEGTFVGFDGVLRDGRRIDFLFARGPVEILYEQVFAGLWSGRPLSDHRPVLIEVKAGQGGEGG